jgi:hypothetical protein
MENLSIVIKLMNSQYSGYRSEKAKRYKWLLSLKERILNDVERETNKYWERIRIEKEKEEKENYEM